MSTLRANHIEPKPKSFHHMWLCCGFAMSLGSFYLFPPGKIVNDIYYAGVLPPAIWILCQTWRTYLKSKVLILAASLLIYFAISTWWGTNAGAHAFIKSLKYTLYVVSYLAAISYLYQHDKDFWLAIAFALALASIGFFINLYAWCMTGACDDRMFGVVSFQNAVDLGISYGFLSILSLVGYCKSNYCKPFFAIMAILFISASTLTGTRMAVLASFIALVSIALLSNKKFVIISISAVFLASFFLLDGDIIGRFTSRSPLDEPRLLIWQQAINTVNHPWTGLGLFSSFKLPVEALGYSFSTTHSIYIGSYLLGGCFALILLTALLFQAVKELLTSNSLVICLLAYAAVASLTHGTIIIGHPSDFWLFWWFPFGLTIAEAIKHSSINHKETKPF